MSGHRVVKFRVFKDSKMRDVLAVSWRDSIISYTDDGNNICHQPLAGAHLMQFTGLFDKNGKEIYEADIIKKTTSGDYYGFSVVKWNSRFSCWQGCLLPEGIEVSGNIYENPELIKNQASKDSLIGRKFWEFC